VTVPDDPFDRRLERRLSEDLAVDMHLKKERVKARVRDVSAHGLFVRTHTPLPLFHVVKLTVHLPGGALEMLATVERRVTTFENEGAGMKLFAMGAAARARWHAFVEGGIDPGVRVRPREGATIASFLFQPADTMHLLRIFEQRIAHGKLLYVTPPVRTLDAAIEVVLVHPTTQEEFAFLARVAELNADRPTRMGVRFDPIDRERRRAFLAFVGPNPDGTPLVDAGDPSETGYRFISPKLKGGDPTEEILLTDLASLPNEELAVVEGVPELELVDPRELFDFEWDAEKK
jgi:hypothetical protein